MIQSYMQMVETIRSIVLFLFAAPIIGLLAAFTHDRRYDELLDDW